MSITSRFIIFLSPVSVFRFLLTFMSRFLVFAVVSTFTAVTLLIVMFLLVVFGVFVVKFNLWYL